MEHSKAIKQSAADSVTASQLGLGISHCLGQCEELLNTLSEQAYADTGVTSASIGSHLRHILDRYQCLLAGLGGETVDYDQRKRDRSVETQVDAARFALTATTRRLEGLDLAALIGKTVSVRESVYHHGPAVAITSTWDRELMGSISHSIHHLAIIAMIARDLGFEFDEDFGKAPSTILFERG